MTGGAPAAVSSALLSMLVAKILNETGAQYLFEKKMVNKTRDALRVLLGDIRDSFKGAAPQ